MKTFSILLILLFHSILLIAQTSTEKSIQNIRRNSIYLEMAGNTWFWSANYDRFIPFSNSSGTILRLGISDASVCGEFDILWGKSKHFLEIGAGYTAPFNSDDNPVIPMRIGYRYQAIKGFIVRFAPMLMYDTETTEEPIDAWFGLSLGYSF